MAEQELNLDSKQRVAYDLMLHITSREEGDRVERPDARTYYLTLYRQCYKAVSGQTTPSILDEKQ